MEAQKILAGIIGTIVSLIIGVIVIFSLINLFCSMFPGFCIVVSIAVIIIVFFVIKLIKDNVF